MPTMDEIYEEQKKQIEKNQQTAIEQADSDYSAYLEEAAKTRNSAINQAEVNYRQTVAGYGRNAEQLGQIGLTGSGYSDYLTAQAGAQRASAQAYANSEYNAAAKYADQQRASAVRSAQSTYGNDMLTVQSNQAQYAQSKNSTEFNNIMSRVSSGNITNEQELDDAIAATGQTFTDAQRKDLANGISVYARNKSGASYDSVITNVSKGVDWNVITASADYNALSDADKQKVKSAYAPTYKNQILSNISNGTVDRVTAINNATSFGLSDAEIKEINNAYDQYDKATMQEDYAAFHNAIVSATSLDNMANNLASKGITRANYENWFSEIDTYLENQAKLGKITAEEIDRVKYALGLTDEQVTKLKASISEYSDETASKIAAQGTSTMRAGIYNGDYSNYTEQGIDAEISNLKTLYGISDEDASTLKSEWMSFQENVKLAKAEAEQAQKKEEYLAFIDGVISGAYDSETEDIIKGYLYGYGMSEENMQSALNLWKSHASNAQKKIEDEKAQEEQAEFANFILNLIDTGSFEPTEEQLNGLTESQKTMVNLALQTVKKAQSVANSEEELSTFKSIAAQISNGAFTGDEAGLENQMQGLGDEMKNMLREQNKKTSSQSNYDKRLSIIESIVSNGYDLSRLDTTGLTEEDKKNLSLIQEFNDWVKSSETSEAANKIGENILSGNYHVDTITRETFESEILKDITDPEEKNRLLNLYDTVESVLNESEAEAEKKDTAYKKYQIDQNLSTFESEDALNNYMDSEGFSEEDKKAYTEKYKNLKSSKSNEEKSSLIKKYALAGYTPTEEEMKLLTDSDKLEITMYQSIADGVNDEAKAQEVKSIMSDIAAGSYAGANYDEGVFEDLISDYDDETKKKLTELNNKVKANIAKAELDNVNASIKNNVLSIVADIDNGAYKTWESAEFMLKEIGADEDTIAKVKAVYEAVGEYNQSRTYSSVLAEIAGENWTDLDKKSAEKMIDSYGFKGSDKEELLAQYDRSIASKAKREAEEEAKAQDQADRDNFYNILASMAENGYDVSTIDQSNLTEGQKKTLEAISSFEDWVETNIEDEEQKNMIETIRDKIMNQEYHGVLWNSATFENELKSITDEKSKEELRALFNSVDAQLSGIDAANAVKDQNAIMADIKGYIADGSIASFSQLLNIVNSQDLTDNQKQDIIDQYNEKNEQDRINELNERAKSNSLLQYNILEAIENGEFSTSIAFQKFLNSTDLDDDQKSSLLGYYNQTKRQLEAIEANEKLREQKDNLINIITSINSLDANNFVGFDKIIENYDLNDDQKAMAKSVYAERKKAIDNMQAEDDQKNIVDNISDIMVTLAAEGNLSKKQKDDLKEKYGISESTIDIIDLLSEAYDGKTESENTSKLYSYLAQIGNNSSYIDVESLGYTLQSEGFSKESNEYKQIINKANESNTEYQKYNYETYLNALTVYGEYYTLQELKDLVHSGDISESQKSNILKNEKNQAAETIKSRYYTSYESVDEMETSLNETLEFIESLYQSQIITKSEYNNYCTRIENRAKKSYKTVPSN